MLTPSSSSLCSDSHSVSVPAAPRTNWDKSSWHVCTIPVSHLLRWPGWTSGDFPLFIFPLFNFLPSCQYLISWLFSSLDHSLLLSFLLFLSSQPKSSSTQSFHPGLKSLRHPIYACPLVFSSEVIHLNFITVKSQRTTPYYQRWTNELEKMIISTRLLSRPPSMPSPHLMKIIIPSGATRCWCCSISRTLRTPWSKT